MNSRKTVVSIGDGSVCRCDTLVFEGRKWLVHPSSNEGARVRTILLDGLSYRPADPAYGADFVLDPVIPLAVWDGRRTDSRFVVEDRPHELFDRYDESTLGHPASA